MITILYNNINNTNNHTKNNNTSNNIQIKCYRNIYRFINIKINSKKKQKIGIISFEKATTIKIDTQTHTHTSTRTCALVSLILIGGILQHDVRHCGVTLTCNIHQ